MARIRAEDYQDGDELILVTVWDREYPVRVVKHTVLPCDVVVYWRGRRPDLNHGDVSTVCLEQLKSVRYG